MGKTVLVPRPKGKFDMVRDEKKRMAPARRQIERYESQEGTALMVSGSRPKTPNRGAADERAQIKSWALARRKEWKAAPESSRSESVLELLRQLIYFLDHRKDRTAAHKGGLGRK